MHTLNQSPMRNPLHKGGRETVEAWRQKRLPRSKAKTNLPPVAAARLKPFIERGIANGIFQDDSSVVAMFKAKASDPTLKETLSSLGGLKSEIGQAFITDIVLTDVMTSILRQKRYTAHMKVWEVSHNTVGGLVQPKKCVQHLWPSRCWRWWWRDGFRIVLHVAMG